MNPWIFIPLFGLAMAVFLALAAHFWGRSYLAKRTLAFMGRIGDPEGGGHGNLDNIRAETLAGSQRMRIFLQDMPFVPQAALAIEQSGVKITVARLIVEMVVLSLVCSAGLLVMGIQTSMALLIGLVSAALAPLRLIIARRRRAIAFEAQLPQSVELIALYLRAGRSLSQAFVSATEEMGPPAGEEFKIAAEEYRLGRPLDQALKRLADRFPDSIGFRLFSIAAAVLTQTGGNLVEVLDRIRKTLEAGVTYGLRLNAMTAEARTSAKLLGVLPGVFACVISLRNKEYFDLFLHNHTGRVLSVIFFVLWATGVLWVRTLIKSKMI